MHVDVLIYGIEFYCIIVKIFQVLCNIKLNDCQDIIFCEFIIKTIEFSFL